MELDDHNHQSPCGALRYRLVMWLMVALIVALAFGCLIAGPVRIPATDVVSILLGGADANPVWRNIVVGARLPMVIGAFVTGCALSVAGLLLQTSFNNPLAGPSILGISTGASLGVAVVLLATGSSMIAGLSGYFGVIVGALLGAAAVMMLLLIFSHFVRNTVMLLIVGILVGYFASSAISLLNFFATQEGVHSFAIWGLGNFSGLSMQHSLVMAAIAVPVILLSLFMIKPLNAMLLGDRYAESMGVNVRRARNLLMLISGVLTAVVTAFCGPIGFLGLIVPHVARMAIHTSNHSRLLPATILAGGVVALLCTLISVVATEQGVVPINAITPIIGVPIVLYVIVNRKRLFYFN